MTGARATILAAFAVVGSLCWFQALKPHRACTRRARRGARSRAAIAEAAQSDYMACWNRT